MMIVVDYLMSWLVLGVYIDLRWAGDLMVRAR